MEWREVFAPDFFVLDIETSGLDALEGDRIIEVGLLEAKDHLPGNASSWVLNPNFPNAFKVPEMVTELTGIKTTDMASGADPREFFRSLVNKLRDARVWGHNVIRFDAPFIQEECKRICVPSIPIENWYDSAAIFKAMELAKPDQSWAQESNVLNDIVNFERFSDYTSYILERRIRGLKYNLFFANEKLNIDVSDLRAHRAGSDCVATYRLIEKMRELILG